MAWQITASHEPHRHQPPIADIFLAQGGKGIMEKLQIGAPLIFTRPIFDVGISRTGLRITHDEFLSKDTYSRSDLHLHG
jgi:hypothetical protein